MSATDILRRTPLADWHAVHGGRLVDFAGWAMPVQYGSIVEEHVATRARVGLFDVSHMGRLTVAGPAAEAWLDGLLTRRVAKTPVGRVRYSLVCNDEGGVLDDILFTRIAEDRFDLVVNASNRAKLLDWFASHAVADATLADRTEATAMIAAQGPAAVDAVAGLADADVASIRYYRAGESVVAGAPCSVSRTGYTGEDGFELICDADHAVTVWEALVEAGGTPCGLAARDTLRLEAGMPLYGHELSEDVTPLDAGLDFAVDLSDADGGPREFVGSAALRAPSESTRRVRVGLIAEGRRPPREGCRVLADGAECGRVTSGTHSPTLGLPIAMAYVDRPFRSVGTALTVDIRGREARADVAPLPFYRR